MHRNDGGGRWFPAEKHPHKSIFPGMKLGWSWAKGSPHPITWAKCSPVAARGQRLLSEGHRGISDRTLLKKEANSPMVLGEKGDVAANTGQGWSRLPHFYGHQEAPQIADLPDCKHAAPPCPSLTRNSSFAPPGTAFRPGPGANKHHWGWAETSPASPALLFLIIGLFLGSFPHPLGFLLPLCMDPALEDSSCQCCAPPFPSPLWLVLH